MSTATLSPAADRGSAGSSPTGALVGLSTLIRFILRRERVRLPVWIVAITVSMVGSAAAFPGLYPTAEARAAAAMTINNPGTTALIGPIYRAHDYTYGVMLGHETVAIGGVIVALMSIFTLVRHTRAEEESARAELVRSSIVGRHASAVAALVVVIGANVALALVLALSLGSLGIESITWSGSLLYGAALASSGLVFAGVASVTVQLTEHARGASSLAGLVLGIAYAVRAAGDVGDGVLSWFSPLGWAQATRVYDVDDWTPLTLSVVVTAALITLAVPLSRRRDVGSGLLPARRGRATASAALATPVGLAVRLNRGNLIGWGIGMFLFGLMYGPVLGQADTFLEDLEIMGEFLPDVAGASGSELFAATMVGVVSIICTVPAVQTVLRLRSEETAGRADPLLATPMSRVRWAGATLLVALIGGAAVLLLFGVAFGLSAGSTLDDPSWLGTTVGAVLAYLPAMWVAVGLGVALFGLVPRAAGWAWAVVVYAVVVLYFGGLLSFPQWLIDVSPFAHVAAVPAADVEPGPLVALIVIAVALTTTGLAALRRRDIAVT